MGDLIQQRPMVVVAGKYNPKKFINLLKKWVKNPESYRAISVRTEFGELILLNAHEKVIMILDTGEYYDNVDNQPIRVIVLSNSPEKITVDLVEGEIAFINNSEADIFIPPTYCNEGIEIYEEKDASRLVSSILKLFLELPASAMQIDESIFSSKFVDNSDEDDAYVEEWSSKYMVIERYGVFDYILSNVSEVSGSDDKTFI